MTSQVFCEFVVRAASSSNAAAITRPDGCSRRIYPMDREKCIQARAALAAIAEHLSQLSRPDNSDRIQCHHLGLERRPDDANRIQLSTSAWREDPINPNGIQFGTLTLNLPSRGLSIWRVRFPFASADTRPARLRPIGVVKRQNCGGHQCGIDGACFADRHAAHGYAARHLRRWKVASPCR